MPGARARSGGRGAQIDATCGDPLTDDDGSCSPRWVRELHGMTLTTTRVRLRTDIRASFRYAVGSRTCHGSVRHAVPLVSLWPRWLWPSRSLAAPLSRTLARSVTGDGGSGAPATSESAVPPLPVLTAPTADLAWRANASGGDSRE